MKSTGEVMGTARSFGKAYDKAQDSTNKPIPESGTAVVDLSADEFPDPDTEAGESLVAGYAEHFELSEATDLIEGREAARSTSSSPGSASCSKWAVERRSPTSRRTPPRRRRSKLSTTRATTSDVMAVSDRPKRVENWGAPQSRRRLDLRALDLGHCL